MGTPSSCANSCSLYRDDSCRSGKIYTDSTSGKLMVCAGPVSLTALLRAFRAVNLAFEVKRAHVVISSLITGR